MTHPGSTILPHPELACVLSKPDVAALSELSDASQVRAWTRRKMARYKKYISALLDIHNAVAPINKLPTEILQEVFAYVPFKSACNASWMLSLQFVCRRWRSVLLATPEYWLRGLHTVLDPYVRVVNRHEDEGRRDLFLGRSAPGPLELKESYTSGEHCIGWKAFEDHFDRVTVFEVEVQDEDDLYDVLDAVTTSMKRLERLELSVAYNSEMSPEDLTLDQWEAEDLPRLGRLNITNPFFCRATTVPSLHTVTLYGARDIRALPGLLDALEGCPALATLCLNFETDPAHSRSGDQTLERIVNLPNLRSLEVGGQISDLCCFLSCLSFPSTTQIDAFVDSDIGDQFALPSILPRRLSGLHTSPTIDRLYLHSDHDYADLPGPDLSMIGFVQGAKRLEVTQACRLRSAADFLRFLEAFSACTVTELALDIGPLPNDMDGDFWRRFFAALPDVRRLELLSRTTQSRETKGNIAEHFLASARGLHHGTSLGWVLRAEGGSTSHLEEELGDVERVLSGHADQGGTLDRLELYITTSPPGVGWSTTGDVTRIAIDDMASRFVSRDYVSRLAVAADTVIVGGGWGFADDDGLDAEDRENRDNGQDGNEEEEEDAGSDDMQVV